MKSKLLTLLFVFSLVFTLQAQIFSYNNDTTQINKYISFAQKLLDENPDSCVFLIRSGIEMANESMKEFHDDTTYYKLKWQLAKLYQLLGELKYRQKQLGDALFYFQQSYSYFSKIHAVGQIAYVEEQLGNIYYDLEDYKRALEYFNMSLRSFKRVENTVKYAFLLQRIANVYEKTGKLKKAKDFYYKSLDVLKSYDIDQKLYLLENLAELHLELGDTVTALKLLHKIRRLSEHLKNRPEQINVIYRIANVYFAQGLTDSAKFYYKLGLSEAEKYNLQHYKILGDFYLAKLMYGQDSLGLARKLSLQAMREAVNLRDTVLIVRVADLLRQLYIVSGNCQLALHYQNLAYELFRTYLTNRNRKLLSQQHKLLEFRSEAKIDSLRGELLFLKELEKRHEKKFKTTLSYGILFISILLLIILFLVVRQRHSCENQQKDIETSVDELVNKLLYHQRLLKQNQKELETLLRQFKIDVENANYLLSSLLPKEDELRYLLPEAFVIHRPRTEIGGDFYWFRAIGNKLFVAVADTTGRGISGALLTFLGIHLLDKAVEINHEIMPSKILDFVRQGVMQVLKQSSYSEKTESINMSLVRLDLDSKEIVYAGAKLSAFLVCESDQNIQINPEAKHRIHVYNHENIVLYELKPDPMPLGYYLRMENFQNISLNYSSSVKLYLFTDGMINQFGGEFDERFGRRRFKQLILQLSDLQINEQKKKILQTFDQWKREHDQTDDFVMIGMQI